MSAKTPEGAAAQPRRTRFSLAEGAVVLLFLAIAGALATQMTLARESEEERLVRQGREGVMLIKSAIDARSFDLGVPAPLVEEGGLQVLIESGYLNTVPEDPWGNDYRYETPGVLSGRDYDLYSLGPDGVPSIDDLAHWDLYGQVFRPPSMTDR